MTISNTNLRQQQIHPTVTPTRYSVVVAEVSRRSLNTRSNDSDSSGSCLLGLNSCCAQTVDR
jgi:hypothetical protein